MQNIYESLLGTSPTGGIQSIKVINDVLFINFKDESKHDNILIEQLSFDYDSELITSKKTGIFLDFGDTGSSSPFTTTGNGFADLVYDSKNKFIYVVGLQSSSNTTVPLIYSYNMNGHVTKNIFPNISLDGLVNGSPVASCGAVMSLNNGTLTVAYQTQTTDAYLNVMSFRLNKDGCELTNFNMLSGFDYSLFTIDGINETGISYKYNGFNNFLKNK